MTGDPFADTIIIIAIVIISILFGVVPFIAYGIFLWKLGAGFLRTAFPEQEKENDVTEKEIKSQNQERKNGTSNLQMRERLIREGAVEVSTEQVPLNNSMGISTLVSEHEFECKVISTLRLEKSAELEGKIHAGLWSVIESEARSQLSTMLGAEIGNEITRRITLKFEAPPGKIVHYRITWKQTIRRGLLEVKTKNGSIQIPYNVTYGLSHSVDSVALLP